MTSAPVTSTCTTLFTGTTISLSTVSSRGWPGLRSLSGDHQRVEFEIAVVRIVVAPEPLLAGRLDGQVGLGHVELDEQQPERRHRDHHQDDDRDDGPDHFDRRVVGGARRRRIGARIEAHDDDQQQRKNESRNGADDPEQEVMKRAISSMTGVAASCRSICQGVRLPELRPARRPRPPHCGVASAMAVKCAHTFICRSSPCFCSWSRLPAASAETLLRRRPQQCDVAASDGVRPRPGKAGAWSLAGSDGIGESRVLQTTNPALPQCTLERHFRSGA